MKVSEFMESQGGLLLVIFCGLLFFAAITTAIIFCAPANERAFLLFSNLVTGFSSSLLTAAQVGRRRDASASKEGDAQ